MLHYHQNAVDEPWNESNHFFHRCERVSKQEKPYEFRLWFSNAQEAMEVRREISNQKKKILLK